MATFYKKTDDGEFVEADKDVDALFEQKSGKIVSLKLNKEKEKLRGEIEDEVRKSSLETIKGEVRKELETEFKDKLDASENKAKQLDVQLRRKTIAAEYGFKPEAEQFLGDGDDDDMRAKADTLKESFETNGSAPLNKQVGEPQVSKLQQDTGVIVKV